jgi:hypothetical protein
MGFVLGEAMPMADLHRISDSLVSDVSALLRG